MAVVTTVLSPTFGFVPGLKIPGPYAGYIINSLGNVFSNGQQIAVGGFSFAQSVTGHVGLLWTYPRQTFILGNPIAAVGDGFTSLGGYWGSVLGSIGKQDLFTI